MLPKAVLFDLDNTLTHRQRSTESYASLFARHYAADLSTNTPSFITDLISKQDNGGYLSAESVHTAIREAVAFALASQLNWHKPVSLSELASHWANHFPTQAIEMPGANTLIEALVERGVTVGVISNGAQRSRESTLAHLPFKQHISLLVSSDAVGIRKPDPRIFLHAAQALGLEPNQCCYVGDHPINDIKGAAGAGMLPVWLSGFHPWPQDEPAPTISVDNLADILPLLAA